MTDSFPTSPNDGPSERTRSGAPAAGVVKPSDRPLVPLWVALPLAAASGLVFALAFPAVSFWPGAYIAIAGLLVALIGRKVSSALLVGFIYGAALFFPLVWWTARYLGPIPWIALASLEALLTAVCVVPLTLAYRWIPRLPLRRGVRAVLLPVTLAALWVARELFIGSQPYGGFPWARVAYTQVDTVSARVASWLGVSGLGFVMVLLVAVVIELVRNSRRVWHDGAPKRQKRRLGPLVTPVALVAVLVLTPLYPSTSEGTMRIGAVQGNGPTGYFDDREPYAVVDAQVAASEALFGQTMDLLAWPEGGVDGDPFQNDRLARALTSVATNVDAPVLANAATAVGDEYFNTSFLWEPETFGTPLREDVQTHAKRHPVPFGEYVPNRDFFNLLVPDLIGLVQREYSPGTDSPVFDVGEHRVGLAICFDVIHDDVIREGIAGGAQVLVFQTNNADFRGTEENLQQLAIARMRAIETGRWAVNISTVGTSQVIRPDGSSAQTVPTDVAGVMIEDVELHSAVTAAMRVGPLLEIVLFWGSVLVLTGAGFVTRRRDRARNVAAQ